jgi:hypothetical protein
VLVNTPVSALSHGDWCDMYEKYDIYDKYELSEKYGLSDKWGQAFIEVCYSRENELGERWLEE